MSSTHNVLLAMAQQCVQNLDDLDAVSVLADAVSDADTASVREMLLYLFGRLAEARKPITWDMADRHAGSTVVPMSDEENERLRRLSEQFGSGAWHGGAIVGPTFPQTVTQEKKPATYDAPML